MSKRREHRCNECDLKEKTIKELEAVQKTMEKVHGDFRREVDKIFKYQKTRFDRDWLRHPFRTVQNMLRTEREATTVDQRTYKKLQKCFFTREERKERLDLILKTKLDNYRSDKLEKENVEHKRQIAIILELIRKIDMLER